MLIEGKHIHMGSTVEVVIYVVLLIEFILCIIGVSYQISLKLTKNLKVFYLCLLVHCVLMVGYFFDPFVEYSGITCAMLYFSANIFIENSINLMIFEWVKIIILSKTQALVTKRLHLELFSYLILCLNIFWWVVFAVLIIISLTSGADLVTLMLCLYIAITLSTMCGVAYAGASLIKTCRLLLGSHTKSLIRWIYLGALISFLKSIMPSINLIDRSGEKILQNEVVWDLYLFLGNNIANILPILIYHKSFKISFQILKASNSRKISEEILTISMVSSDRSFPSLTDDYMKI